MKKCHLIIWLNGWLKRHADLVQLRGAEIIESRRFSPDLRSRCIDFVNMLDEYQSKICFNKEILINVDEN